jgi:hypothetical protein
MLGGIGVNTAIPSMRTNNPLFRFAAAGVVATVFSVLAAAAATNAAPVLPDEEESAWSFSAYAYTYLQEGDRDYLQPTFTADRGWLHLEARYNYEDYETFSFWVGYNWSFGEAIAVTLTPMVGGALGETKGVAPGFRLNAEWWKLTLYSEGEYFFDADDSDDDFFYNWSELNLDITHGLRAGLVMQKETSEDVRRGFSVGYTWEIERLGDLDLGAYFFDLDKADEMYVFAIGLSF